MVEPDQHPEPVVGEQAQEDLQAPGAERLGRERPALVARDDGAHGAVLVVPGRVRRHAQEGVDHRRHPQAPAQHADRLLDQAHDAVGAEQVADRAHAALQERGQQDEVDAEQRCRQRPVDHAGQRLVVEQPDAAFGRAEADRTPFAEQRVDDVVAGLARGWSRRPGTWPRSRRPGRRRDTRRSRRRRCRPACGPGRRSARPAADAAAPARIVAEVRAPDRRRHRRWRRARRRTGTGASASRSGRSMSISAARCRSRPPARASSRSARPRSRAADGRTARCRRSSR